MVPEDAPPPDGELCCVVAPPPDDGDSRLIPVPCAFAKPVPAIKAAVATEINKRFVISIPPHKSCIARADNERRRAMFRADSGSTRFVL
jgi:hypothetical protein